MFIIYDLIFLLFAIIYLPIYLCRRKFHRGFLRRLGILPANIELEHPIWIHAVSVGEVMTIRGLLNELRTTYPQKKFVLSTVTPTGNRVVQQIASKTDFVTYLPLDFSFIVKSTIDRINPSLFIIAETEIWPNLITHLYQKNIPMIVVNGRISDRSFRGYLMVKFLLKPILNRINLFCLQTQGDAQRLLYLGVSPNKIQITGNMKFDIKDYRDLRKDYADYRLKLGLGSQDKLLVAGSTHSGEEEIIFSAYKNLCKDFTYLRLLIAPRHPERTKEIAKIASQFGFRAVFVSSLSFKCDMCITTPIYILDIIGELVSFYCLADIVFVGGSLVKKGGHNILEPASLAKPILSGPHLFNFRDIADLFLEHQACILVHNQEEIEITVRNLLNNPVKIAQLGKKARELILENQGATLRNLELIKNYIN